MSRVFAQYFIDGNIPFQSSDSDRSHGSFIRFYEGFAEHVQLENFQSPDLLAEAALQRNDKQVLVDLVGQSSPLFPALRSSPTVVSRGNPPKANSFQWKPSAKNKILAISSFQISLPPSHIMLNPTFSIRAACASALLACLSTLASAEVFSEYEAAGTKNAYHTDPNVNSRRTDHFLIRFGPKPKEGFMVEQMYQGQLQFLENCYETWQTLGLHPLGGPDPNTKYKLILQPHQTWDGDTAGTAVSFEEPIAGSPYWVPGIHLPGNSLGYKAPNGTTPHECGHGWQNQGLANQAGLPATTPQGLTESLANWFEQQAIAGYPQDWISGGLPMGHAAVGYNCTSIFNYFMEAPGYGANFINKLVFDPNLNTAPDYLSDDVIRKAIRVDTSGAVDKAGAIRDGLGMMNAKMLNMDFWNHRVNNAFPYDQDAYRYINYNGMPQGYHFTRIPMVRQPGVSGIWYRPQWTCTPQSLSNSYIPLTVTATGSLRTVTCDFQPVADAVRGTSFRACFVAFGPSKEPRYGRLWNAGVNSFTLGDGETAVYLAVIACPKIQNAASGHSDYTGDNVAMFPYRISLTGADPKGWQWPVPGGLVTHANGGGKKASSATVDASAYIGPNAMVLGTAKVYGNSRIEDFAVVDKSAVIGRNGQADNPVVSGHAYVTDTAQVYGHAKVRDYGWVWGASKVYDNAIVMAHTMLNGATVYGSAVMNQAPLRDPNLNFNGSYSGSAQVGGDCSSLGVMNSDRGVWCEFPAISVADNKYQYLGYNFQKKSSVFAMDQYGMNHSYLLGEPQVVGDTVSGVATSVISLNGVNQYVELRPDAVDFADITIAAWVKWNGSGTDQMIFSTGNGATTGAKVMHLTPKDGTTGNLRWTISDGTTTQYLNGTGPLQSNVWTHVAITLAANTGTLFVNGTAVDINAAITIDPDQLHAPLMADWNFIGRGNSGNYFAGRIDEFKVYNKTLSAAEVAALLPDVTSGVPASDFTAPTPNSPTFLVSPVAVGNNAITMSAIEGTDGGGNGVLYYFRCITDSSHDSGWISENKFTDCIAAAGTTYSYTVRMKDKLGNIGSESSPASAATPAADFAAPTPNPPVFTAAPKGTSTTSIAMSATKGTDDNDTVLYKFTRTGTGTTSGWTGSPNWNDTGVTPGGSYTYTLQMMDGLGNTTSISTAAAVARDDTPPVLDADFRLQWDTYPYTQLDKTVRMYARELAETAVDYYYECVEIPTTNSGWISNKMWVSPAMADGTYTFRFKLRDRSPQLNVSPWSTARSAKVLTTNSYNDYALTQLSALPDSTLVRFNGKVTAVGVGFYTVSTTDGLTSIKVVPRTFAYQADATLLNKNVNIKGHLWTYTGTPKCVTGAVVAGSLQSGKIEFENCDYDDDLARPLYDINASGTEYLGWFQSGWSVTIPSVTAVSQLTLAYAGGGGTLSLYVNGANYTNLTLPSTPSSSIWGAATITGLNIPAGVTLRLQQDAGDASPYLDYMILGPAYTISGKVTNTVGTPIAGAIVCISGGPNAALNPTYSTVTDASGNYTKTVPNGTWYVAATAASQAYITSTDQTVIVNGANVSSVNIALEGIVVAFPRASDLLFSLVTDMIPDSPVSPWTWSSYSPTGMVFTSGGNPTVETTSNNLKWERNNRDTQDCFRSPTYSSSIPINGATIVVAVKPIRTATSGYRYAIVNAFFDRLSLGIENSTGFVSVWRNGSFEWASNPIPDGQITVLSLVVQPTGEYKVYANGIELMSIATTSDMTSLVPNVPGVYANTLNVGNNGPDGASAFNGNIGDVAFYKVALTDAERNTLEANMTSKFVSGVQSYAINATAGTGGTITPGESVAVTSGANQTFTITPLAGYAIAQVTVDAVPLGAIGSYTFTNVLANHTINATFISLPTPDITLTRHAGTGNSSTYGETLAFDVSIDGTPFPTGTVDLKDGGPNGFIVASATLAGGACTITTTALAVGSHPNIVAVYSGDGNYYTAISSALSTQTVNPATPTVTVTGTTSFTYNGSPQGPNTAITSPASGGSVTYSYAGSGGTSYGPAGDPPTGAGSYTVTATVAADSNNFGTVSAATAFAISKATPLVTVTGATSYTYTGSPQGPITATTSPVSSGAVSFSYAGTASTTYPASSTRPTELGTYTATATIAPDSNNNSAFSSATGFVIGNSGITELAAWTNLYHSASPNGVTQNITYNIPASSAGHRMLVVAIAAPRTSTGSRTVTAVYGGQTLTLAKGDLSANVRQHTALYYLNEAGLTAATTTTLAVTVSGGSSRVTDVFAAVYDGVDQTNPITDSKQYNGGTIAANPFALATGLQVNAGDQALAIICSDRLGNGTPLTVATYAPDWNLAAQQTWFTSDGVRNMVVTCPIPSVNRAADTMTTTMSGDSLGSMTALSLAKAKGVPSLMVTNSPLTYNDSAQTATVTGSQAGTVSNVLYNGVATIPIAAGTYAVTADFIPTDTTSFNSLTASPAGYFVIGRADLTVAATGPAKSYGTALATGISTGDFTALGAVADQLVTSIMLTPDAAGLTATTPTGAAYVVTPSMAAGTGGFAAENYNITYLPYNGTVIADSTPKAISFNVGNNGLLASSDFAGAIPVAQWNELSDSDNPSSSNLIDKNGDAVTGMTASFAGIGNTFNSLGVPDQTMLSGFLTGNPMSCQFTNIPYGRYDVYVYYAGFGANYSLTWVASDPATATVLGSQYSVSGTLNGPQLFPTPGLVQSNFSTLAAAEAQAASGIGGNWFKFSGLTAANLAIAETSNNGNNENGIAGIQIVDTTPVSTFATWIAGYPSTGGVNGFNDDPDHDGINNGLENYLGTDPSQTSAGLTNVIKAGPVFTFRHTRSNQTATDVTAAYQWSDDLVNWYASGQTNTQGVLATITDSILTDTNAPASDVIEVSVTVSAGTPGGMFARLQVSQTP
jgi:hypothetical protein